MANVLETTAEVISELGGPAKAAEITGRKYTAAWNWSKRATFPPNTFLAMRSALHEKGKTAPARLWRMDEPAEAAQ